MPILYIYGPPGSGKTTNSVQLMNKYKCKRIIDEYRRDLNFKLKSGDLVLGQRIEDAPDNSIKISIKEALK